VGGNIKPIWGKVGVYTQEVLKETHRAVNINSSVNHTDLFLETRAKRTVIFYFSFFLQYWGLNSGPTL
jgi:hypothetical protein